MNGSRRSDVELRAGLAWLLYVRPDLVDLPAVGATLRAAAVEGA